MHQQEAHHPGDQQRSYECADIQHGHVGGRCLRSHLFLGASLQRDPAFCEEYRRVPEPAQHEDEDRCDENSEVIDRGPMLHGASVGGWLTSPARRPMGRIYRSCAQPAAVHTSLIAAPAARRSASAAGSYADSVTPTISNSLPIMVIACSTSSMVSPPPTA